MQNVIVYKNLQYECLGVNNGDHCLIPKSTINKEFASVCGFRTKIIAKKDDRYLAFPNVIKVKNSLIGLYSNSASHASQTIVMVIRSDDNGITWSEDIFTIDGKTFSTLLFNELIADGESLTLKIYTISNTNNFLTVSVCASVLYNGDEYLLWSNVKNINNILYRTGYTNVSISSKVGLFKSLDGGKTWQGVSVIFNRINELCTEADIVVDKTGKWVAICREASKSFLSDYMNLQLKKNELYMSRSDDGIIWSDAVLIPMLGTQPNLIKLTDNTILLSVGDRYGASSSGNNSIFGCQTTGIALYLSNDNCATWGFCTMIANTYSTDGGQPNANEISPNRINVVFYRRKDVLADATIESSTLNTNVL